MDSQAWLASGFLRSVDDYPDRYAVEAPGAVLTYRQMYELAGSWAASLCKHTPPGGPPLTAVAASRSTTAFAGIIAALLRGHGYVPLNPQFPAQRTRRMLDQSGCRALIVDQSVMSQLDDLVSGRSDPLLVLLPDTHDVQQFAGRWPKVSVLGRGDLAPSDGFEPMRPDADSIAYLLFTSGSTGLPKGVIVSHQNVTHFLNVMQDRYGLNEHDRLSQMFDLVFDLSLFDMFMAWQVGACVCCPSKEDHLLPANYVTSSRITVWFSVPSVAVLMDRLGLLQPGALPGLRWSLFCGEPLSAKTAAAWSQAAENSVVENLYGPTEVTLACMLYRWKSDASHAECDSGIVPIGEPYPGMAATVVDDQSRSVAPGETGELLMSGPQVALGYWEDPANTSKSFIRLPDSDSLYYRTGDLVRRPIGDAPMTYVGRVDHQIKIRGLRVELGEIESVLCSAAGVDRAVAIGWPVTESGADGVVAFVEVADLDADCDAILNSARERLPAYMVPKRIHLLSSLPHTPNGKVDRRALQQLLSEKSA